MSDKLFDALLCVVGAIFLVALMLVAFGAPIGWVLAGIKSGLLPAWFGWTIVVAAAITAIATTVALVVKWVNVVRDTPI